MSYVIMNIEDYQAICDAIRQRTNTNDLLLFGDVCEKIKKLKKSTIDSIINNTITNYSNDRITEIASYLFYERKELTEINFANVTTINSYAFYSCSKLTNIFIPNVTTIKNDAFENCSKLTELNLLKLETLGGNAFRSSSISSCYFPMLKTIGDATFGYTKFTEVTDDMLPMLTGVPIRGFRNCASLTYVKLSKVKTTGLNAFYQDTALIKVDFTDLTTLSAQTFNGCTKLETLILRNKNQVVSLGASGANTLGAKISGGTGYIYVPSELVESYKIATNWSVHANQIRAIEDYPEICGE